jgi:hypothetical protein
VKIKEKRGMQRKKEGEMTTKEEKVKREIGKISRETKGKRGTQRKKERKGNDNQVRESKEIN